MSHSNTSQSRAHPRAASIASIVALQAVLAAAFLTLSPQAQAQPTGQAQLDGPSGRIGMVAIHMPTYEGSPNHRMVAAPDLTISYRSREWGSVEIGPRGLFWNAVEQGRLRLAVVAQFDPGRKDRDVAALNPTPGDKRLAGMGTVQPAVEAGLGVGYGPLTVVARQSLGERGARGSQVDMRVEVPWPLSDRLSLRLAAGATWADRDVMQTYFGVTAAQARATRFAVYTPRSGCRKAEASLGADYVLASSWTLRANLDLTQLGDQAAASPIVGRRYSALAALGVFHDF